MPSVEAKWVSLVAQLVKKSICNAGDPSVRFLGQEDLLEKGQATHSRILRLNPPGFPGGSAGKESACNAGDLGLIPGLGRSPEEGKGYPLQYSGLENSMDCVDHGVPKSRTRLSDFHFHFQKEMATHSSILAWRIPWTEEPGGLQSMGHKESDMTE